MARAIVILIVLLAIASTARAGERRRERERLRLSTSTVCDLLTAPTRGDTRSLGEPRAFAEFANTVGTIGDISLPPFFTLFVPPANLRGDKSGTGPLLAIGARIQGRRLIAFTRPGARTDPDDRVVYQRLVASDLFEGRRFSVTVYEDHALGPSRSQVLGFGARLLLRPALDLFGWRTRVELFASYDLTQGATGYLALVARSPASRPPAPTAFDAR